MTGTLFVISAPSGAGKSTILHRVLADLPAVAFSVSHTTRKPRPGEEHGRDYFFVSPEEFASMREKGAFLEAAEVHGNWYGTSRQAVRDLQAQGLDVLLDIDVQGAEQVRAAGNTAVFLFIAPPSLAELERRLRGRGTDSEDVIRLRLANARRELLAASRYDHVIVNDDLDRAVAMVEAVILARRSQYRRGYDNTPIVLDTLVR